jgi:hypothetical protein
VIKNNTKGTSVSKSITSTAALCEENAEWIVEDFESGSSLVPFANFGARLTAHLFLDKQC